MIFYFLAFLTQSFAMNSKATPIDSVNLNGAKLLALTGGGGVKRRDLQKGFAIIECSGKHSFFMTETFAEYEKWVIAIQRSLSSQNNNLKDQAPFDILVDADIIETESENDFAIDEMQSDYASIADSQSIMSEESNTNHGSDIERTKKLNLREKAKNRMSQTLTAVKKNVKIDTNAIRQLNNGAFQNMNVGRKPNNFNNITRLSDNPSTLKLRGLKYGTTAPVIKEQIVHRDQEMCAMIGVWGANASFVSTHVEDQQNTNANRGKINIELKCYKWKEEVDNKPADILISKEISELLKFHSELSDALLAIRRNIEITGLTLANKDSNDLFSQVLHSGRLMKGMLDHLLKGNNVFFTESICKFEILMVFKYLPVPCTSNPFSSP